MRYIGRHTSERNVFVETNSCLTFCLCLYYTVLAAKDCARELELFYCTNGFGDSGWGGWIGGGEGRKERITDSYGSISLKKKS